MQRAHEEHATSTRVPSQARSPTSAALLRHIFLFEKVGDLVVVWNDEEVPCDLVLVCCSEPSATCYIETSNLDGEAELKARRSLRLPQPQPQPVPNSRGLGSEVKVGRVPRAACPPQVTPSLRPSPPLSLYHICAQISEIQVAEVAGHALHGKLLLKQDTSNHMLQRDMLQRDLEDEEDGCEAQARLVQQHASSAHASRLSRSVQQFTHLHADVPLARNASLPPGAAVMCGTSECMAECMGISEMGLSESQALLQGSTLKNTAWAVGVCIYSGQETRLGRSRRQPSNKRSCMDGALDSLSSIVFALQATASSPPSAPPSVSTSRRNLVVSALEAPDKLTTQVVKHYTSSTTQPNEHIRA